ncbi:MAG TPA: DUF4157 domain-containing protein [Thermoanaerobaculia bacterium]|nr:DUF4157 domain-containing protein [Thermoanaerobaculia bacterium]
MAGVIQGTFARGRAVPQPVQRHAAPGRAPVVQLATHGGQPLPPQVRQRMEAAFGARFDDVRIHVAPQVQTLGANALTQGSHIHFAPGQYNVQTHQGVQLLGRELAHVVQQRSGRVRNPGNAAVVQDGALEAEADRLAQQAVVQATMTGIFGGVVGGLVAGGLGMLAAPTVIGLGTLAVVAGVGGIIGQVVTGNGQQPVHGPVPGPPLVIAGPVVADITNQAALARIQSNAGGSSQGTLALFLLGGTYYAIEQETNTNVSTEMARRRITYIPQTRLSGFHAEMRFVKWCADNGRNIRGAAVWVSKGICQDCQDVLNAKGVTMHTSADPSRYYSWVDPATCQVRTEVNRPVGVFHGRRTEAERLKPWNW